MYATIINRIQMHLKSTEAQPGDTSSGSLLQNTEARWQSLGDTLNTSWMEGWGWAPWQNKLCEDSTCFSCIIFLKSITETTKVILSLCIFFTQCMLSCFIYMKESTKIHDFSDILSY